MFFRRVRPPKYDYDGILNKVREAGFETTSGGGGTTRVFRSGIAAVVEDGGDRPRVTERAGVLLGNDIASLVDGGFQKFFQTRAGVRKPAVAVELKAIHEFEEDLREVLGLTSLYNESLGSVSSLYLYDRVKDRDSDRPKKPWELKIRGANEIPKI